MMMIDSENCSLGCNEVSNEVSLTAISFVFAYTLLEIEVNFKKQNLYIKNMSFDHVNCCVDLHM